MALHTKEDVLAARADILVRAKSKVDIFNIGMAHCLGNHYVLGAESWGHFWGNEPQGYDQEDCSGLYYGVMIELDQLGQQLGFGSTKWKDGGKWRRLRVVDMEDFAVKVTNEADYHSGCVVFFGDWHVASLVWRYNGVWHTVEARHGTEESTLPELQRRYGYRGVHTFPFVDWQLPVPEPEPGILVVGMSGEQVLAMRTRLSLHLGTGLIGPYDVFTPWTAECVKTFQWLCYLPATGAADPATLAELAKTPVFPYLAPGSRTRYAGLAVRHLKRSGYATKLFSDWTDSCGYWLGQEVKKWRASEGLPAGTHLGPEGSWPALLS